MKEDKKKKAQGSQESTSSSPALIAKKDFEIHHNEYRKMIKAGDDLSDVPEHYHQNLRTEGVL